MTAAADRSTRPPRRTRAAAVAPAPAAANAAPAAGRVAWKSMPVQAIQPRRMYEQIAEQLEQLIRQREFRPGDRLPPERELAQQLGVSRPSVREAMIALETAGLIEVRTGSGTYVRALPQGEFRLPWAKHDDAGPGVREQFQARKLVEPELAALAVESISDAQIAQLEAAIDRAERKFAAQRPADEDDYFFHVSLAAFSRNTVLAALVRHLWDLRAHDMWKTLRDRVVLPEHRMQVVADRREIVEALRLRDAKQARAAMSRLMKSAERRYFG
jgi:DNA-binding FadR family transcriptional regulator